MSPVAGSNTPVCRHKTPDFRPGTATAGSIQLGFQSSEAGALTVLVERPSPGRKVGTACKKAAKKLRKHKKCTLYTKVAAGNTVKRSLTVKRKERRVRLAP